MFKLQYRHPWNDHEQVTHSQIVIHTVLMHYQLVRWTDELQISPSLKEKDDRNRATCGS